MSSRRLTIHNHLLGHSLQPDYLCDSAQCCFVFNQLKILSGLGEGRSCALSPSTSMGW